MTTNHIEEIFSDYITTDKTQFAILLNGSWGCGKTYFWKYTLENIAKQNDYKTIYVSLNGINKIETLDHQLFIKLLPFISNQENKIIRNATAFFGNVFNKLSSHYLKSSLSEVFKGVSIDTFNFSKYIICFDDLERCQIPVKEVLGFINNLVEHKNLKTIILAHEPEIIKGDGYERIKEKIIGRDLKFELDIASTLPNLFAKYQDNTAFYDFLSGQTAVITDILIEYKQDNLRIISFYLDTLSKIYPGLKNADPKYIQEIILFSAVIAIEYKKGGLPSSDYSDFKDLDIIDEHYYSIHIANTSRKSGKEDSDRVKKYAEVFYERYLEKNVKTYFFYPSIYSYVLSGYFDKTQFEDELKRRYPEIIPKETQAFRALLNYKFRELSDEDFKTLTKNVLQYAEEGKYFIYDYVQIANFFYYFINNKLISESKEEIDDVIKKGLDLAKKQKAINSKILDNLLHFADENPDVTVIKKLVKEIHYEIKKEEYVANGNELIECLVNKDELELSAIFKKHELSKEFFQYADDKLLFEALLKIPNKQLFNFTELLQSRYTSSNIGEFLFEDAEFLSKLNVSLSTYLDENENIEQPRKYLLSSLETGLIVIIDHLNNTRKK
ncbi:P-loop NTPase fold protein [Flavobacterium pectinovorum]|uniref:KAP family P-loop domain-containing protein n=1 Tax=Flavobacterium pectinovorum TaxID=29533 RepID=A0AB36P5K9_9FLAO|nr:P-loop NTPase fold protein [Flavobacterium pectinovorum]OXB07737.1 hypothetical protein B0A72_02400 [Flavobacterium pectinovorum]SHM78683.1 KAP family P-loop domain-containing protein [Flavobacterium pectinovorum]